ncbi:hypothetical protein [Litchfieldia alkalitelluris]|uniref:hypothetical protein n=1 Tax=Litchfieldia alkalitelluris TaxID=304268 RepID=UPI00195B384A
MEYTIIALLSLSIILLILSFFKKDSIKELEDQIDQLSMTLIQETYQLKKKISVLEEELLVNDATLNHPSRQTPPRKGIDRDKLSTLFQGNSSALQPQKETSLDKKKKDEAYFIEQIRLKGNQS